MEQLSQIDFDNPDSCYLFPIEFRGRQINLFLHFNREKDNSNARPRILEFLERLDELADKAYATMPTDADEFTAYYADHLHDAGYRISDDHLRKIYGKNDRTSVSNEDFYRALKIANISFNTDSQCGTFDFSPDPQEYDQWLAMTVDLNGTPRNLSWES